MVAARRDHLIWMRTMWYWLRVMLVLHLLLWPHLLVFRLRLRGFLLDPKHQVRHWIIALRALVAVVLVAVALTCS